MKEPLIGVVTGLGIVFFMLVIWFAMPPLDYAYQIWKAKWEYTK